MKQLAQFVHNRGWKKCCAVLLVLVLLPAVPYFARRADAAAYISADEAVKLLQSQRVLAGYPGGDLRLDQPITSGEYLVLLERALKIEPKDTTQFVSGVKVTQPTLWDWSYYWFRQAESHWSTAQRWTEKTWFNYMYTRRWGMPWKVAKTDWQYPFLRDAYLDGMISFTFNPRSRLSGMTAVSFLLRVSGFGDESTSLSREVKDVAPEDALRIVCAQHGLLQEMFLETPVVTRREAVMMIAAVLDRRLSR